jgi:pectate lyase
MFAATCIPPRPAHADADPRLDALVRDGERLARETLAPDDGWAAFAPGTTGGADAAPGSVFVVSTRRALLDALALGSVSKIVLVLGTIDANVDDNDAPLACGDYAAPGYSLEAYLTAYDPATWGRKAPSGPLETARRASQANQQRRIRINVPSNTTIVGLGADATIVGAHVRLNNANNVIVRNLTFEDAFDCFPQWDPTDGSSGNWNSQYDNISLTGATHVWVDHTAFNDGSHPDRDQPVYLGRPYQWHDGELDITNASDLVTVSWNRFTDHDKVMLIGSSDSASGDRGKLRVTLHHNLFDRVIQRGPRVRFEQVHIYNDYYVISDGGYSFSWGVGVESQIFAENNFFEVLGTVTPDRFIRRFGGTAIHVGETCVNGPAAADCIDVLEAYNAVNSPALSPDVGWTPELSTLMHPTEAVPALVWHNAGPFREAAEGAPPR